MFNDSNQTARYYKIIKEANARTPGSLTRRQAKAVVGYVERHHIIPKSLGGENTAENLVWLTANEHLAVHLLLPDMVDVIDHKRKMLSAAVRMCNPQSRTQKRTFDTDYTDIRKEAARFHSEFMKGKNAGCKNPFYGRTHTEESKALISKSSRGQKRTDATRANLSASKLGDKNPAKKMVTCPHCSKVGLSGGMRKHHFDHCKKREG